MRSFFLNSLKFLFICVVQAVLCNFAVGFFFYSLFHRCNSENRRRFSTPIRMCSINFKVDFRKHVIDENSYDWFKFIVFVWFVCKQCRIGISITFFLIFVTICKLYECIIAAATTSSSSFFDHVCFRSRKPAPIFEVENRRRFSTPKIGIENRPVFDPVCLQPYMEFDTYPVAVEHFKSWSTRHIWMNVIQH